MRDFLNPDAITIDGVTITREQFDKTVMILALTGGSPFPLTWESFVAANTKPAPKYPVGSWVVPPNGNPAKITQYDSGFYWVEGVSGWVESDLRLAVREDFMAEFKGVKVWMEEHPESARFRFRLYHEDTETTEYGDGFFGTPPWEVEVYKAAGVMFMPEEFWE